MKRNYFGIYNSWDRYNEEYRNDVRQGLAEANEMEFDEVPEYWVDDVFFVYLDDEKMNLNEPLKGWKIIAFACLGLWNGAQIAYKRINSDNLNGFLQDTYGGDEVEFYADRYNVRAKAAHHDGTNNIVFRMVRTEQEAEKVCEMIYDGRIKSERQLFRHTTSLRPLVARAYGWQEYGWQKRNAAALLGGEEKTRLAA